jgi:hypothetical protein
MPTAADLQSTVLNPLGVPRFYSYLGSHGITLPAGGTYAINGSVPSSDNRLRIAKRKIAAFSRDLVAGMIQVLNGPRAIVHDTAPAAGKANPTVAATVNVTGGGSTGGALAAGQYVVAYTWATTATAGANPGSETLVGASQSVVFTVAAGNIPQVTIPSLPGGVNHANIYLSLAGNSLQNQPIALQYVGGTTGTTFSLNMAMPTYSDSLLPPIVNTTGGRSNQAITCANGTLGVQAPSWGGIDAG